MAKATQPLVEFISELHACNEAQGRREGHGAGEMTATMDELATIAARSDWKADIPVNGATTHSKLVDRLRTAGFLYRHGPFVFVTEEGLRAAMAHTQKAGAPPPRPGDDNPELRRDERSPFLHEPSGPLQWDEAFLTVLVRMRIAAKLSQTELGYRAGVNFRLLSDYECRRRVAAVMAVPKLRALCDTCGVELSTFFQRVQDLMKGASA